MGDRVTRNTGGNPLGTLEWLHNKEYCGMYPLVSDNKDHSETILKRCQWCTWENFLWFRTCFRGDGYWGDLSVKKDFYVLQVSRVLRTADQVVKKR